MAIKIGEVFWKISGDTKDIDKSLKGTETKMGKFAKAVKGAFITTAVIAFGKATFDIGKKLIGIASDAEETRNKFNVVFADVADAANQAAEEIAEGYGLSQTASEKYLSGVGDIVTGLGATADQALTTADTITRLAVDIDSFANLSGGAEQAVQALTSLFTGEREAAKALGIVINDTNLKAYAEGFGLVFSEMTPLEKGTLSLQLATEQSTLAIGDFERSQDSFANQLKIAKSNVQDLGTSLGEDLLPVATEAVSTFNDLIQDIITTREEIDKLVEASKAVSENTATSTQKVIEYKRQLDNLTLSFIEATRLGYANADVYEVQKRNLETLIAAAERQRANELRGSREGALNTEREIEEAKAKADWDAKLLKLEELRQQALDKSNQFRLAGNQLDQDALLLRQEEVDAALVKANQEAELWLQIRNLNIQIKEDEKQAEQERHDARIANIQSELQAASQYAGNVGSIFSNLISAQMAGDDELTDRKKKNIIALYRIQQAANIAQIAIDTAAGIMRALVTPGGFAGIALAALIGGMGITQAAVVAATPPPVKLADGGIVPARPGGTSAILGEAGQAEAVIPLDGTSIAGGGDTVLMIDGEILARWTQSQINNRAIVVPEGSMV